MKTLSISLYNRPQYTKILFDKLNECYDIENYSILICCEPKNEEVIQLCKNFRPQQTTLIINPQTYGCNINIFQCLTIGFANNNYHIHLEDDTIPGKDALLYFEWAGKQYINDTNIFNVSGYVNVNNKTEHYNEKTDDIHLLSRRNWFTPWGWATWKDRWDALKPFLENHLLHSHSWDYFVHKFSGSKYEIYPRVSRIQNIGAENGTYVPSASWHSTHQYNDFWIESLNKYTNAFIER